MNNYDKKEFLDAWVKMEEFRQRAAMLAGEAGFTEGKKWLMTGLEITCPSAARTRGLRRALQEEYEKVRLVLCARNLENGATRDWVIPFDYLNDEDGAHSGEYVRYEASLKDSVRVTDGHVEVS